jgi:hypothetical protein
LKVLKKKIKKRLKRVNYLYRRITSPIRILPSFLIIGPPKCGTTSLYEYLIQHPNIIPAYKKELKYFDLFYKKGEGWYRSFFCTHFFKKIKYSKGRSITGEATPYYIFYPLAPLRIKTTLPDAKIICIFRNPTDRAYSHYGHEIRKGRENLSFRDALNEEHIRLKGEEKKLIKDPAYYSFNHHHFSYLSYGHYEKLLKYWYRFFDEKQILILKSEDLFKNPNTVVNKVFKFLDVPEYNFKEYRVFGKTNKLPEMDQELRKKLLKYFRPYNEKLYNLISQDFNWEI